MINKLIAVLDDEEEKEKRKEKLDWNKINDIFSLKDLLREEINYRNQNFVEDYYIEEIVDIFKNFEAEIQVTSNIIIGNFYYIGNFKFETKLVEDQEYMRVFLNDEITHKYRNGKELFNYIEFIFETKRYHETQEDLADSLN